MNMCTCFFICILGQLLHTLKESHQYVQGVAWDPMGRYIAALSCDRNLRIYSTDNLKFKCVHTVSKITTTDQVQASHNNIIMQYSGSRK